MFFNLGCLPARVKACVVHLADEADAAASGAFQPTTLSDATSAGPSPAAATADPSSPTAAAAAGGGIGGGRTPSVREAGAAAARRRAARMRAHAGKLAASLHSTSMEAWGLQRVMDKKRDPTTRALLDATVRDDREAGLSAGAYRAYWDGLCRAVRGAVERTLLAEGVIFAAEDGGGGRRAAVGTGGGGAALVAMYPFLRKAFLHLMKRLEDGTQGPKRGGDGGEIKSGLSVIVQRTSTVARAGRNSRGGGGVPSWSRAAMGASGGNGGIGVGVLGGSRWLSLALDDDGDNCSSDEEHKQGERWGRGGGAEAGAGPSKRGGGNGRWGSDLRRRGKNGEEAGGGGAAAAAEGHEGSDGARLLEALGPLRDVFLARSLERLTTPVEQMFPQV